MTHDRNNLVHDAARRSAEIMTEKAEGIRAQLRDRSPAAIAQHSGAELVQKPAGQERLTLSYLSDDYTITYPDFEVYYGGTDKPVYPFLQAILLAYLQTADGTPRAHRWVSFRELPNGQFYHRAFQGYTGNLLSRELGNNLAAFKKGAEPLAEIHLSDYGDAAYSFQVLPRVYMAAIYWLGDEEFAPRANILFDRAASHYMTIDGLAVIGSQLTGKILRGAKS